MNLQPAILPPLVHAFAAIIHNACRAQSRQITIKVTPHPTKVGAHWLYLFDNTPVRVTPDELLLNRRSHAL